MTDGTPGAGLADVAWGDVISDKDGVLVVRGDVDDVPVVVKRYATARQRREIATYDLLGRLGVPTLPVLGAGEDWLILEDLVSAGYRPATTADLQDPAIGRLIAGWYDKLHAAGDTLIDAVIDYSELDLIDDAGLAGVEARWPELAPRVAWARAELPGWHELIAHLPRTLTHNDFAATNLAIAWHGGDALMYDHNLTGMGLRASDLRNVRLGLGGAAAAAFLDEYARLAEARGVVASPEAEALDDATSHLVALILASELDPTPAWASASLAWAGA